MSSLNLSRDLLQNLMRLLEEHDEQAKEPLVAAQYLSALIGLLVGNQQRSDSEKQELLNELHSFSDHVCQDVSGRKPPPPPAADPSKAFGIWKPPGH